jgi:hypothetical protein
VARARLRVELAVLVLAGLASPNLCNAAAALVCDADHSRCYGSSTWSSKPDAIDEAMDKCIKSGSKCAIPPISHALGGSALHLGLASTVSVLHTATLSMTELVAVRKWLAKSV